MKDQQVNKTAVAGVVGAVVGAAAVATVVALKDEKTRKKIEGAIDDARKQAKDFVEAQSDQVDQIKADGTDALDDTIDEANAKKKEIANKAN